MKKFILLIIMIGMCVSVWGADSTRTRTQLETIFADNITGAVSEQDLRDFVKSIYLSAETDTIYGQYVYRALLEIDSTSVTTTEIANNVGTMSVNTSGLYGSGYGVITFTTANFAGKTIYMNVQVRACGDSLVGTYLPFPSIMADGVISGAPEVDIMIYEEGGSRYNPRAYDNDVGYLDLYIEILAY